MWKKIYIFFALLMFGTSLQAQEKRPFDNLTILVPSCDKYQELWHPFYELLFKAWPTLKTTDSYIPIVMVANHKKYEDSRIKMFLVGDEKSWSDNMIQVLNQIKTDYILIILEDYYFNKPVNVERLKELFEAMKKEDAAYIQLGTVDPRFNKGAPHPTLKGVYYKPKHSVYRNNLQAALWNREDLLWLINPAENVWDFEIAGSIRSEGMHKPFMAPLENPPFEYLNGTQNGYWNADVLKYLKEQGLKLDHLKLPVDADHKFYLWYKREFLTFLYYDVYLSLKGIFLKIAKYFT